MRRNRARSIYVNGCPAWECPECGALFNAMDVADVHVKRCRALHRA